MIKIKKKKLINRIILKPSGPYSIKTLANISHDRIYGDEDTLIYGVAPIDSASTKDITFIDNIKYINELNATNAKACIVNKKVYDRFSKKKNLIFLISKNPYLSYAKLLRMFYPINDKTITESFSDIKIDKSAIIYSNAQIKSNVEIRKKSIINAFSVIGPNVEIGENCYIGNNVSISNTIIENNVNVQDGTIIGQDGFGYVFDGSEFLKVPQIGIVKIGSNVDIGANCTIDRGSLKFTEIKKGVKIDNLVHVAHNVIIGENTIIAGQSGIAGSSIVGKNVLMGGQVGISGHLKIEDNVQIGAQSGVTKNITKNKIVSGTPSIDLKTYLKQSILLKKMVKKK